MRSFVDSTTNVNDSILQIKKRIYAIGTQVRVYTAFTHTLNDVKTDTAIQSGYISIVWYYIEVVESTSIVGTMDAINLRNTTR